MSMPQRQVFEFMPVQPEILKVKVRLKLESSMSKMTACMVIALKQKAAYADMFLNGLRMLPIAVFMEQPVKYLIIILKLMKNNTCLNILHQPAVLSKILPVNQERQIKQA